MYYCTYYTSYGRSKSISKRQWGKGLIGLRHGGFSISSHCFRSNPKNNSAQKFHRGTICPSIFPCSPPPEKKQHPHHGTSIDQNMVQKPCSWPLNRFVHFNDSFFLKTGHCPCPVSCPTTKTTTATRVGQIRTAKTAKRSCPSRAPVATHKRAFDSILSDVEPDQIE